MSRNQFNKVYDRNDLSDEDKEVAIVWVTEEFDEWVREWSESTKQHWKVDPTWEMVPLHEYLGGDCHSEEIRKYFWGMSLIECCSRHMGSSPIAVDSDETTPKCSEDELCYCCDGRRRHNLRILQRAFKIAVEREEQEQRDLEEADEAMRLEMESWDARCVETEKAYWPEVPPLFDGRI
jgi:hypothetical protein